MKAGPVYARELGWAVIPLHDVTRGVCSCSKGAACPSAGKHPRLTAWEQEATSDAEIVAEWLAQWPAANVGVATGRPSGFFALDVDPEKGGVASLERLIAAHGELPETVEARTGSGGTHYLFRLPAGVDLRNSASKLGAGLDTRGDGGQIVVAPSVSAKGAYAWVRAPFKTPIAEPPEWLVDLLTTSTTPELGPGESTSERGFFPPATREILDEAAEALERHGPAIDGQGGGLHTVQAGAILTHDFALTDEEAWPLLCDWNETCRPPWELEGGNSLRVMLRRGRKYGKAVYGSKRSLDVEPRLRKLIADSKGDVVALVEAARPLFRLVADSSRRAVLQRELVTATGLKPKELDLPPADRREAAKPGTIEVTVRVHEVADQATQAIAPKVFQRGGVLCEVALAERVAISELATPRIVDLMSATSNWARRDGEGGLVTQAPPEPIAAILGARRAHEGVRVIEAVTSAPVFLADGTILQERGYNEQARLWLEPNVAVEVDDAPTQDDARRAVALFEDLLCDFELLERSDFAAWLAGLLSPLVKPAIANAPAPLIVVSASSPGAGKSKLATLASLIVTGSPAEIRPYNPRDPSEWGKRLTSYVRAASPISVFDNVNGAFGDQDLDRLLTSSTWSDRILGASDAPPLPVASCWWATGNNIEPQRDTIRRCLFVRIDTKSERPQERTGFRYAAIEQHVRENRARYLSAALTILRAFHVAGRPASKLPEFASFDDWSAIVRHALVWAGTDDPFLTQQRAQSQLLEEDEDAHDFWIAAIDGTDGAPAEIAARANQRDAASALGLRDVVTVHGLRKLVARFVDKPRGGVRIRKDRGTYRVERIAG